ncbi:MAG: hypothetical protein JWP57_4185, partial [Spirosoma sp.]|nr:hypothetical protein [Spirosoma sp.]
MKRWISFSSHLFAGVTSFVALMVAPVVAYGAVALARGWQSGDAGDPSSIFVLPLLSGLGAGLFSAVAAPMLSVLAQKCTRRFGWSGVMFPALLACGATFALALGNSLLGWQWAPALVIGGGVALGAAFSAYWVPLRWAQKVLAGLDAKTIALRERCQHQFKPLSVPASPIWETGPENAGPTSEKKTWPEGRRVRVQ